MEVDPRSPEKASLYGKNNNPVAAVDVEMASQNNSALEEVSLKYFYEARPNRNEFRMNSDSISLQSALMGRQLSGPSVF